MLKSIKNTYFNGLICQLSMKYNLQIDFIVFKPNKKAFRRRNALVVL